MQKIFIVIASLFLSANLFAQNYKLKTLLKAYNSSSLNNALAELKKVPKFKGGIVIDSSTNRDILLGTRGQDSIVVLPIREKMELYIKFCDSMVFTGLHKAANKQLYFSKSYPRGSNNFSNYLYMFSNHLPMKHGDLWFILSVCRANNRIIYYEVELATYYKD